MIDAGIDYKDAINYTVVGCNEWCICGKAKIDLAHINLLHSLSDILYNQTDKLINASSYEDVYKLYEQSLNKDIFHIAGEYSHYFNEQAKDINVLTSALMVNYIRSAKSFTNGGTEYYGLSMSFNSISNVADSLSVIKQFVFDEKLYTMQEMPHMLNSNWVGFENERNLILKKGRFFGNDDNFADSIACDIVNSIYAAKCSVKNKYLKNLLVGSFVGATHPNIVFGKMTKATPDGRNDGEKFTMGIGQSQSKDKKV